jgi:hypothetical protein
MSPAARKALEEEYAICRRHEEQVKGRKLSIPLSHTSKQRSAPYLATLTRTTSILPAWSMEVHLL